MPNLPPVPQADGADRAVAVCDVCSQPATCFVSVSGERINTYRCESHVLPVAKAYGAHPRFAMVKISRKVAA